MAQHGSTTSYKVPKQDPEALNIPHLERQIVSLNTANDSYQQLYCSIEEQFPDQIDATEEEEILTQHLDSFEEAETLSEEFIKAWKDFLNNSVASEACPTFIQFVTQKAFENVIKQEF